MGLLSFFSPLLPLWDLASSSAFLEEEEPGQLCLPSPSRLGWLLSVPTSTCNSALGKILCEARGPLACPAWRPQRAAQLEMPFVPRSSCKSTQRPGVSVSGTANLPQAPLRGDRDCHRQCNLLTQGQQQRRVSWCPGEQVSPPLAYGFCLAELH